MGRTEEVSAAIADETEITAIEEAGIIAQSKSAEADDNPADRRLPLIARIYGIVMLVEGVVTLPIIVISCLYAVRLFMLRCCWSPPHALRFSACC